MKPRSMAGAALLVLSALFVTLTPGVTPRSAAQGTGVKGPIIGAVVAPKSFDGSLTSIKPVTPSGINYHVIPIGLPFGAASVSAVSDPVVQSGGGTGAMPSPSKNFAGLSLNGSCTGGFCGAGWPPDPNADVGPNNIVETVNTSIGIFSKTGTRQVGITFDSLWSVVVTGTPCNGENFGDPIALYDPLADRWLVSDFAFATDFVGNPIAPYYQCIAVSKSGDPVSGGWWFYPILADNTNFSDYPKFAVWPDAYYMTVNMFTGTAPDSPRKGNSPASFAGARVWAFDRSKMINGQSITPIFFNTTSAFGSLLAGNLRGAQPPANSPAYVASIDSPSTNTIHVWKLHIDFTTPANSWFGRSSSNSNPVDIPVAAFTEPCNAADNRACIPEKGATKAQYVDSLGDRLMYQLQYRNINGTESLWATHTVANSPAQGQQTGIRWYQLDVTGGTIATTPVQEATYKPSDGIFRWMPSIAVDKFGNMAVGYSVSSSTLFPGIRYAGRLSTDPANALTQGEAVLFNGAGAQTSYPTIGNLNRWGDYSSLSVDPSDDCTFWYTNEYFAATGFNWQTRIGSFSYPQCALNGKLLVDEMDPSVQDDGWQGVADGSASGGSYRVSDTTSDNAKFTFTGTSVKWVYVTGPDEGNAKVTIDGKNKGTVNLYSASPQHNVSKTFGGLASASHNITIQVLGTHDPSSTDNEVVVDAFVVGGTTTQDTAKAIRYNTWTGTANKKASGGTYRYSNTLNDTATFSFNGTAVQWVTVKGKGYGKAEVFIDTVDQGTVDLYASTTQYQVGLPPYSGLSSGPHTIKIQVLHTKNALATGFKVAIDAFIVTP